MSYTRLVEDSIAAYTRHPVLPLLFSFLLLTTAFTHVVSTFLPILFIRVLETVLLILATGLVYEMAPVMEKGKTADVWEVWHRFEEKESRVVVGELTRTVITAAPAVTVLLLGVVAALLSVAATFIAVPVSGVQAVLTGSAVVAAAATVVLYVLFSFTLPVIVVEDVSVRTGLVRSARFVKEHLSVVVGFFAVEFLLGLAAVLVFAGVAGLAATVTPQVTVLLPAVFLLVMLPFFAVFKALFYIRVKHR